VGGVGGRGKQRQWLGRRGGRWAAQHGSVGASGRGWWWRSAAAVLVRKERIRKTGEDGRRKMAGGEETGRRVGHGAHCSLHANERPIAVPFRRTRTVGHAMRALSISPF
jgi:hypothetical protein